MKSILIVEDDEKVAALLKQYIEEIDKSIAVNSFAFAATAYNFAKVEKVSLFILDIQLLDYKGTSLAKQLRKLPQYKFTPIIFASALSGEELSMYRDVKCCSFLVKPFTKTEFLNACTHALEMSEQLSIAPKTLRINQKSFICDYEIDRIIYVESLGKRMIIHSKNSDNTVNSDTISGYTLSYFKEILEPAGFVQCHKSYLINRKYIRKINKPDMAVMLFNDSIVVPIGEKYRSVLW